MAEHGKPWHVCDDCLEPLASALFALAGRFHIHFDVAKRDRLEAEFQQIQEESAYCDERLTETQRARRDEIQKQLSAQKEPPRPMEVAWLYKDHNIDLAIDWLKFNVSVDYAEDFKHTLESIQKRFYALDFKACQIINGDLGKETTISVRYAIQRLIDRHYEILQVQFPDLEHHPERDELPDELRAFEVEILDEYTIIEKEFRKTAEYLQRVSALVRSKMAKTRASGAAGLIDRLLAGPDDAELLPRELALLEAHLQQPVSFATIQQEKQATGHSTTEAANKKLKLIRDFNRRLTAKPETNGATTPGEPTPAVTPETSSLVIPSGFLGGEALADALSVHPSRRDAFFKRLERARISLGDDNWQEVANRQANTPRYQYRADSPRLRELANAYKEPKPA